MTFEDFLNLVRDKSKTDFQLAADLHAAWQKAATPSALNIKPKQERKKREAKATKVPALMRGAEPGPSVALMNGADDHGEAH